MNEILVDNWNKTVSPDDIVLCAGDFSMGNPVRWIRYLNGDIVLIKGSHDKKGVPCVFSGIFLVLHDPADIPRNWKGWTIHAHKHNSNLINYPFINYSRKLVNVSVEMTEYKPVSLDTIKRLCIEGGDFKCIQYEN